MLQPFYNFFFQIFLLFDFKYYDFFLVSLFVLINIHFFKFSFVSISVGNFCFLRLYQCFAKKVYKNITFIFFLHSKISNISFCKLLFVSSERFLQRQFLFVRCVICLVRLEIWECFSSMQF